MNENEAHSMTETEIRVAIAEACGWKPDQHLFGDKHWHHNAKGYARVVSELPDYLRDLNAMHGVEKVLFDRNDWSASRYEETLQKMTTSWAWHSTAAQRAEAFLRTIGKWKE